MTDASSPSPDDSANDLESQLEALMKQARESGGTADATQETGAENAVAVESPPTPEAAPEKSDDLASQLDALMAKAGNSEADASEADAESSMAQDPPGTDVITDGPADVEDALDDLQGAFDAVQDVIAEIEGKPDVEAAATPAEHEPPLVAEAPQTPTADAVDELPDQEDDLAAQVQSLLDEANAEEADSFVSPEELLDEAPEDQDKAEDDGLDGHFEAVVDDAIVETAAPEDQTPPAAQAAAPTENASAEASAEPEEVSADDAPLIEQIDSLLADHADDAISGEFESVDELLGVKGTSGENNADPTDDLDAEDEDEDDGLGGDFQSMDDLLAKPKTDEEPEAQPQPSPAASAEPRQEEPSVELDEIDGLFEAPQAISEEPAPRASTAEEDVSAEAEAEGEDEDQEADGGFESLDAMLDAPPPSIEDRDGSPPAPPVKAKSKTKSKSNTSDDSFKLTINLALLQTAAALLLGWTLWTCGQVNKPIDKLPDEMKQTVGWVALAVAAPGMLLVVYGLLFN